MSTIRKTTTSILRRETLELSRHQGQREI